MHQYDVTWKVKLHAKVGWSLGIICECKHEVNALGKNVLLHSSAVTYDIVLEIGLGIFLHTYEQLKE